MPGSGYLSMICPSCTGQFASLADTKPVSYRRLIFPSVQRGFQFCGTDPKLAENLVAESPFERGIVAIIAPSSFVEFRRLNSGEEPMEEYRSLACANHKRRHSWGFASPIWVGG